MSGLIRVFIETPAGSLYKHVYDEASRERIDSIEVPAAYPYPYGYSLAHMGADGECVDCYLITDEPVLAGTEVDVRVVGLIEQFEAGAEDHKVLTVPADQAVLPPEQAAERITAFMRALTAGFPDMLVSIGQVRSARSAMQYLTAFGPSAPGNGDRG